MEGLIPVFQEEQPFMETLDNTDIPRMVIHPRGELSQAFKIIALISSALQTFPKTEPDEPIPVFGGTLNQGFLGSLLRNNERVPDQSTHETGSSLPGTSEPEFSQPVGRSKRMTKKSRKQRPRVCIFKKDFG